MNLLSFRWKSFLSIFLVISLVPAFADDESARTRLKEATALYAERAQPEKLAAALEVLAKAEGETQDKSIKYDILILQTKLLYFRAGHSNLGDKKKAAAYEEARDKAEAAIALNATYADAYFWSAACLSRWAEIVGIPGNLIKKPTLMKLLGKIDGLKTREGKAGETLEGYGSSRMLGRINFVLPPKLGGDYKTAVKLLKKARDNAPTYASNIHYYAEALYKEDATKGEAKDILDKLLKQDPKTYNLNRIPETEDEFEAAKKFRKQIPD